MIIIYTTCKSLNEAKKISCHLIKKKLCACTNFFPINSIYKWKGKIINDKEIGLFIKTKDDNFAKIKREVKKIHSYTTPCIISIKVNKADRKYLKWLNDCLK